MIKLYRKWKHLKKFKYCLKQDCDDYQSSKQDVEHWWRKIIWKDRDHPHKEVSLPNVVIDRECLEKICKTDSGKTDLQCLISIMAWGSQGPKNAREFFGNSESLKFAEDIVGKLRSGSLSYLDAYKKFFEAQNNGTTKRIGPAFYTKIIFFCDPTHKGYIMDQWTAKSVNLLSCDDIIKIEKGSGYVKRSNEVRIYEQFCGIVNNLASQLNLSGEDIEKAMYSKNKPDGWWRVYVSKHYDKTHP